MADDANKELLRQAILHAVFLQQYKAGVSERVLAFLNTEVLPEITRRIESDLATLGVGTARASRAFRRAQLSEQVLSALHSGMEKASKIPIDEMKAFSVVESDWQVDVLRSSVPVRIDFDMPSPQTLRAIVDSRPFEGALLKDWFSTIEESSQRAIAHQIQVGLTSGESIGEISLRLTGTSRRGFNDGVYQTTRRNADTIVRTAVSHVSNEAREETYRSNLAVIKAVKWVSTLDSRTTLICQSRDGKIYMIGEGPRPPAHMQCRSTTVPVLKSWKELGFKFNELTERTRASLTGQVPERITYGDWLKSQSSGIQDEALGPARGRLFRQGKFKVDQFIDRKGRTLTLEELGKMGQRR